MADTTDSEDVTRLLQDWSRGDMSALKRLIPKVIADLRQMARRYFKSEPDDLTLQPTALVNEVYLRLVKQRVVHWENRSQFFSFAGLLMRRILVDAAKARKAERRGGGAIVVPLDEALKLADLEHVDFEDLDEALRKLEELDARQAQIVDLRFFVGLSNEEIAEALGISVSTVKREWVTAKLWLLKTLRDDDAAA
jgi:RNA polymerase sigma factor (TIGR02999 family)